MKIGKHDLPAPVYSTDVYLAAVLRELVALNETMQKLTQRAQPAVKDTIKQQAIVSGAKGKTK